MRNTILIIVPESRNLFLLPKPLFVIPHWHDAVLFVMFPTLLLPPPPQKKMKCLGHNCSSLVCYGKCMIWIVHLASITESGQNLGASCRSPELDREEGLVGRYFRSADDGAGQPRIHFQNFCQRGEVPGGGKSDLGIWLRLLIREEKSGNKLSAPHLPVHNGPISRQNSAH